MRPEINKTYRCQNGSHVRIDDVYPDHAYGYTTSGASRRIRYDMRGCPLNEHHGFTLAEMLSTPDEPELMFSFAQPGEMCVRTVSETELKSAIEDARRAPYSPRPVNHALLANAAERLIEQAKAPPLRPKTRADIESIMRTLGLDPDKLLKPGAGSVHYTKEPSNMCFKPDAPTAKAEAERAAINLSKLMSEDLSVGINPIILRLWLVERWDQVAELAHKIHGSAS